ncbi:MULTISPECIES: MarR family winged helix-turn-helix transcriptional regulator [Microbacterium]|jgi:DNA-binding MarR family transcriptional regulator|uniref:MarR family transcriptional regulator n=1 Tax=Microbacterium galbinum TaxID=2851646 RepID=A0ABY4INK0_9MICO|nr:MarR family transcriptional regulator [Microbacterium galbinum]MCK2023978.1 MarR family transcriptional regulator [Microbacterium galbinum]MCK2030687.1 MarR family transcriptional regulator [Microbacterium galbinum]UPL13617.1 MarR family transcriptional regulator [Microbacterium galbinum]
MIGSDAVASPDAETALGDLQTHLNLIFARTRTLWRESAARISPELQVGGYKLLTFIDRAGSVSAHELAERFEMDKSVVSRQVRMLEDLGLIESRPDERDGRLRVLTATPSACAALAELRRDHGVRLRAVVAELTPEEIHAASKVFRLLSEV